MCIYIYIHMFIYIERERDIIMSYLYLRKDGARDKDI